MTVFDQAILEKIKPGILLFNEEKFWECHEELEHIWLEDANDNIRLIYWAIIQVAATNIHVRDQNFKGAHGLLAKSKDKFERIQTAYLENEFLEKTLNWSLLKKLVFNIKENDSLDKFKDLFLFKFPKV